MQEQYSVEKAGSGMMHFVMLSDADAKPYLVDGNKRSLMYLVSQPKTSDKRIERALFIAERIKSGITSPRLVLKK